MKIRIPSVRLAQLRSFSQIHTSGSCVHLLKADITPPESRRLLSNPLLSILLLTVVLVGYGGGGSSSSSPSYSASPGRVQSVLELGGFRAQDGPAIALHAVSATRILHCKPGSV